MRHLVLFLFFMVAAPAFACGVESFLFDRPEPFVDERVEAVMTGSCPDSALPLLPRVQLEGTTVTIDFAKGGGPVLPAVFPWGERLRLPRLFAGEYTVIVRIAGAEVARRTLVVRDRPFRITPDTAAPGEKVLIEGVGVDAVCPLIHCAFLGVFFGGVEAESVEEIGDQQLLVTVPQGSGRVDVRVELRYGDPVTFPGGFTYDFHDVESDRLLVPLNFAGPGAQGSQWTTDVRLRNDGPVGVDVLPPLFPGPPPTLAVNQHIPAGGRVQFDTTRRDGGAFLHATRGLEKQLTYASHVRDLSRSTTDLGAEMPLVRAEDTARTIRLLEVPVEARYRARLRVYDYDAGNGREVAVTILSRQGEFLVTTDVTLSGFEQCFDPPCLAERPAFAVLDLDQLPALRGHDLVDITLDSWTGDGRIWGFVSVTNNDTQAVTLYTPQHRTRAQ